ncbi:Stage 0 sporulation protein KB [Lacticaseibacillus paracasei]|nr:Stage 0 sporulation protein KB [Lacticaseibacillus paracasei]RNE19435.1 Stage 0 sporulation protein KB [Lacticaseibacillus paracasei]
MVKLIVRRFVELLIATFLIATATFFMVAAVPGDALSAQTDKLPAATRAQVYQNTGLDKPVLERYGITMNNMLHGQFGESISDPSVRTCLVSAESGRIVENRLRSLSCQIIQAIFLERNLR